MELHSISNSQIAFYQRSDTKVEDKTSETEDEEQSTIEPSSENSYSCINIAAYPFVKLKNIISTICCCSNRKSLDFKEELEIVQNLLKILSNGETTEEEVKAEIQKLDYDHFKTAVIINELWKSDIKKITDFEMIISIKNWIKNHSLEKYEKEADDVINNNNSTSARKDASESYMIELKGRINQSVVVTDYLSDDSSSCLKPITYPFIRVKELIINLVKWIFNRLCCRKSEINLVKELRTAKAIQKSDLDQFKRLSKVLQDPDAIKTHEIICSLKKDSSNEDFGKFTDKEHFKLILNWIKRHPNQVEKYEDDIEEAINYKCSSYKIRDILKLYETYLTTEISLIETDDT